MEGTIVLAFVRVCLLVLRSESQGLAHAKHLLYQQTIHFLVSWIEIAEDLVEFKDRRWPTPDLESGLCWSSIWKRSVRDWKRLKGNSPRIGHLSQQAIVPPLASAQMESGRTQACKHSYPNSQKLSWEAKVFAENIAKLFLEKSRLIGQ